jgi:hypothetical protein
MFLKQRMELVDAGDFLGLLHRIAHCLTQAMCHEPIFARRAGPLHANDNVDRQLVNDRRLDRLRGRKLDAGKPAHSRSNE